MRLTLHLLGVEVFAISTDPPMPPSEGDGVEITRHSGDFQLGFTRAGGWTPGDAAARIPQPPNKEETT